MKLILYIIALLVQATALGQVKSAKERAFDSIMQIKRNCVGKTFEGFDAVSLTGKRYSFKDIKGKIVFVTFWFTGCKPCMEEIPALKTLYQKYKANPNIIFLSFTIDDKLTAKATVKKYKMPYPVLPIAPELSQNLNCMNGYPTNMVIDLQGIIVGKYTGLDMLWQTSFFTATIYPQIDSLLLLKKP